MTVLLNRHYIRHIMSFFTLATTFYVLSPIFRLWYLKFLLFLLFLLIYFKILMILFDHTHYVIFYHILSKEINEMYKVIILNII